MPFEIALFGVEVFQCYMIFSCFKLQSLDWNSIWGCCRKKCIWRTITRCIFIRGEQVFYLYLSTPHIVEC